MQSYPFTSQVTYDEQDMPIYDRAVDSAFLRQFQAQYYENGIFYKPTSAFQVRAGSGMEVLVNPGACQIQGAFGIETAQRALALKAASTNDRIDTVVLRLDLSLSVRSIDLYILTGTEAASPKAPDLTRNSTVWELGIANILIPKNTTSVSQQRITDTRLDNSRCGLVAHTIGELDTTPYFEQVQAMIEEMEKTIEGIEGGSGFVFSVNGQSGHVTNIATTGSDGKLSSDEVPSANSMELWNLGTAEEIPSGSDLNTYSTPGVYECTSKTICNSLLNKPNEISNVFKMVVQRNGAAGVTSQTLYYVNRIYFRYDDYYSDAHHYGEWAEMHMNGMANLYGAKDQFFSKGNYGFNFNNSDVIGFNGIYFNDAANDGLEGLNFPKSGISISGSDYVFKETDFYTLRIDANGELKKDSNLVPVYGEHIGKTLWSGSWKSGSITIPNLKKYRLFALFDSKKGTVILVPRTTSWFRGLGGYISDSENLWWYAINAEITNLENGTVKLIKQGGFMNKGVEGIQSWTTTSIVGIV